MASAVLETLSLRARAGEEREALEAFVRTSIDLLCGPVRARP